MTWRSLARKTEFQRVYEEGAKRVGRFLVVYLLPAEDNAQAVVASRKVGGAVQRNRAKRLLREALPPVRQESNLGPSMAESSGRWIVLVARRNILKAKSPEVAAELRQLLENW